MKINKLKRDLKENVTTRHEIGTHDITKMSEGDVEMQFELVKRHNAEY